VSAVILAVRASDPRQMSDFVMGFNRWCDRVLVDAALMRDEYTPFRLDAGGIDPASAPHIPLTS
jgi:hypothetical protein